MINFSPQKTLHTTKYTNYLLLPLLIEPAGRPPHYAGRGCGIALESSVGFDSVTHLLFLTEHTKKRTMSPTPTPHRPAGSLLY